MPAGISMKASGIDTEKFRSAFVIVLALAITGIFAAMIWEFLKALLLAAVFSGLLSPVYRRLVVAFRGRKTLASITTILLVLLLVLGPVSAFLGIVVKQAVEVSQSAIPWLKEQMAAEHTFNFEKWIVERVPYVEGILPNRETVLSAVATIAQNLGNALVASASRVTAGTAAFILNFFIMLYAMFFFLIDGRKVLNKIFYYTPLAAKDDEAMLDRFASITRATMKGTIVIALIQGTLGGIAFWVAGIKGAAFWGTIMVLLSVVPGIGTPLVWIPAVIYHLVTGEILTGILLTIWFVGVVGSIDNVPASHPGRKGRPDAGSFDPARNAGRYFHVRTGWIYHWAHHLRSFRHGLGYLRGNVQGCASSNPSSGSGACGCGRK